MSHKSKINNPDLENKDLFEKGDYEIVDSRIEQYVHLEKPIRINTQALLDELNAGESSIIVELFEIDTSRYSGEIIRLHNGKTVQGDIVFNSKTYKAYPFEVADFEIKGDGSLPRPKITMANIDGFVSQMIQGKNDFVGLKVTRIRTFLKYLDAENFVDNINPFGSPDYTARFPDDSFIINQKQEESKNYVAFELVSALDLDEANVPTRIMYSHHCPWTYRGIGCAYGSISLAKQGMWAVRQGKAASDTLYRNYCQAGNPIADENDKNIINDYGFSSTGNASWQTRHAEHNPYRENTTPFIYSGYYDSTGIYSSGDWVKISNLDPTEETQECVFVANPTGFMAKQYPGSSTAIDFYNVSGKDPRFDKQNWIQDQCSKTIEGCKMRFKYNTKGLRYGGFPGIDKYKYQ